MAKKHRKFGASLEDKYLGRRPDYGDHNPLPTDPKEKLKEWRRGTYYFYYLQNNKVADEGVYNYCTKVLGFSKKQIQNIKKIQSWKLRKYYKTCAMVAAGWPHGEDIVIASDKGPILCIRWDKFDQELWDFEKQGSLIKKEIDKEAKPKPVISIQERTKQKVLDTIYADFDDTIIEGWMDNEYDIKFSCYNRWKMHGLKGNSINMFKELIMPEYEVINDAYKKTCDQAVEAYSHVKKGDLRKMINQMDKIFDDLEKLRASFKAARVPRATKPKTSDKQVERLQYKQEDIDAKLASIKPVLIPGKNKLWVYNTKQRTLAEYATESAHGFQISGTSIKNFEDGLSKVTKLRKPDDILPEILARTEKQIEKIWGTLTTKINKPTGRINKDCILLRVL